MLNAEFGIRHLSFSAFSIRHSALTWNTSGVRGGSRTSLARSRRQDACSAAHLCHYDFHSGNVLVERKDGSLRLSGILDFEGAIAGDPLMDIAKALYYFTAKDEPKTAGLLAGYGAIERANWRETVDLYRLYCTLEIWCWMAQIGNQGALAGLTEELRKSSSQ